MNINAVNTRFTGIQNKQYNTNFKGVPLDIHLRNIKGNKCACCGHEMIPQNKISEVTAKIAEPLKESFTNGKMSIIEQNYPLLWRILQSLADSYPNDPLTAILEKDDNYTVYIKSIANAFDEKNIFNTISSSDRHKGIRSFSEDIKGWANARLKPLGEMMDKLSVFKKYMYGYRKDLFEEMEYLAYKYPERHITEVIRDRSVSEGYIMSTLSDVTDIAKKRDLHIAKADNIILNKDKSAEEELKAIHTQIYDFYKHLADEKEFIYKVKNLYLNLLKNHKLESLQKKVFDELEELPTNLYTKNTFLSHARRYYTDGEIVNYLLKPLAETEEHIVPYGISHNDSIGNKITMCRNCNVGRKNIPYTEYLRYHPEMIKNTTHQIDFIAKKIIDGTISPEIMGYPVQVAQTLTAYTEGLISPDITDYVRKLREIDVNFDLR